jgi:hypothetical protein
MFPRKGYTCATLLLIIVLLATLVTGCKRAPKEAPAPDIMQVSEHMVPDVPLDVYVYLEQDQPTVVPAGTLDISRDAEVVSLSIWGVPYEDTDFSIGGALNFTTEDQAASAHADMRVGTDTWLKLSGSTVYVVKGNGAAAATLRTALENNKFKRYDDSDGLAAARQLPGGGADEMVAVALLRPSTALIRYVSADTDSEAVDTATGILALIKLKTIAAAGYATRHIDGAQITAIASNGGTDSPDLSIVAIVNASLPGIIVGPLVDNFLPEQGFKVEPVDEIKVYLKQQTLDNGGVMYLAVSVDGSKLVLASAADRGKAWELALGAK